MAMLSSILRFRYSLLFLFFALAFSAPFYVQFLTYAPGAREINAQASFQSSPKVLDKQSTAILYNNCVAQNVFNQCYTQNPNIHFLPVDRLEGVTSQPRQLVILEDITFYLLQRGQIKSPPATSSPIQTSNSSVSPKSVKIQQKTPEIGPPKLQTLHSYIEYKQQQLETQSRNLQSKIDNEVNLFLNPELLRTLLSNKAALMSSNILPTRVNYGFKSSPSGFLKRYMNYLSGKPHDKDRDLRDNPDGTWSNVVYLVDAWDSYRENFFSRSILNWLRSQVVNQQAFRNGTPSQNADCLKYSLATNLPTSVSDYINFPVIKNIMVLQDNGVPVHLVIAPLNPYYMKHCETSFKPYFRSLKKVAVDLNWQFTDLNGTNEKELIKNGNFRDLVHIWTNNHISFYETTSRMFGAATGLGQGVCGVFH